MKNSSFGELHSHFPNQSNMQGWESEKKSNIQQIRNALRNFCKPCEMPKGVQAVGQRARLWKMNFASLMKLKKINFATPYEIFAR